MMRNQAFARIPRARNSWPALLLATWLAWPALAGAQGAPVGELELIQGRAKIAHGNETIVIDKLGAKRPLAEGDIVQTGTDGRAAIRIVDTKDTVQLYASSYFQVQAAKPAKTSFVLSVGKALFNVLRTSQDRAFGVQTPTAAIGVKGTEFVVGFDGDTTYLLTVAGKVGIVNSAFQQREIVADANQASASRPRQVPTPPLKVKPEQIDKIVKEDRLDTLRQLPFRSQEQQRQEQNLKQSREAQENVTTKKEEVIRTQGAGGGQTGVKIVPVCGANC